MSCSVSSGAELERQSGPINITNYSHACRNVICRYTGTLPTKEIGLKKKKGKTAGFQLGKEKSLWLKKLFNVPGKNRVSMNVILGCKGLKDRSPQSDVFYVEISDFIDIFFMHTCQYYGHTKQSLYNIV